MRFVFCMGLAASALVIASPVFAHDDDVRAKKRVQVQNKDDDRDRAVSTTRTTSFTPTTSSANDPTRRDVVESRAEERRDVEGKNVTLAPMLGYGTNGLGLGVGARLGYTFRTPVYIGANYMYHAGTNEGTIYTHYPSGELGYDIGVGPVLFRPYGGVGALFGARRLGDGTRDTLNTGVVYPGLTAHYLIPKSPAFVGADGRVLIPFEGSAAVGISGTAGLNF